MHRLVGNQPYRWALSRACRVAPRGVPGPGGRVSTSALAHWTSLLGALKLTGPGLTSESSALLVAN